MELPHYVSGSMLLLGITLVVSIVAGSLLMIVVSFLLLTALAGLVYRTRVITRDLSRDEE